MKLVPGSRISDFSFEALDGHHESFLASLTAPRTALLFHRFAGCRLCQLAIRSASLAYDRLRAQGWEVYIVVQSSPANAAAVAEKLHVPFPIVCDPSEVLYQKFEILPAASREAMGDADKVAELVAEAGRLGLEPGAKEGNPLQLPAAVVLDETGKVLYSHYAKTSCDMPDIEQLPSLVG